MKINISLASRIRKRLAAFSLVEAVIGMGVMGTVVGALMSGFTTGFFTMRMARENLRATQIILERMEGVRLYNWDQLTTSNAIYPGYLPTEFTNYYYPLATNGESKGIAYRGSMTITNADLSPYATYGGNMRKVMVTVDWESGGVQRIRTMTTYQARNGMQNYVYNN